MGLLCVRQAIIGNVREKAPSTSLRLLGVLNCTPSHQRVQRDQHVFAALRLQPHGSWLVAAPRIWYFLTHVKVG